MFEKVGLQKSTEKNHNPKDKSSHILSLSLKYKLSGGGEESTVFSMITLQFWFN